MFSLVSLCMILLFDIATYTMQKESRYKGCYYVVHVIEAVSSFFVLYGALFPAIVVCAFVIHICIAFYLAYIYSQECVLREEARVKLLPYTDEGGRIVLPGPDRKEAAGIRGDGTVRKIVMEKPLSYYFSCDVPLEGLSLQGDDLRRNIV